VRALTAGSEAALVQPNLAYASAAAWITVFFPHCLRSQLDYVGAAQNSARPTNCTRLSGGFVSIFDDARRETLEETKKTDQNEQRSESYAGRGGISKWESRTRQIHLAYSGGERTRAL